MSIIINREELLENCSRKDARLREQALKILEAGLWAIDTEKILRKKLRVENGILYVKNGEEELSIDLPSPASRKGAGGKVYFVGIGKCALDGAKVIEDILGDYLTAGAVIDVRETTDAKTLTGLGKIKYFQGTHPFPSEQNISVTKKILDMVKDVTEKDLVITLISGGGSSLLCSLGNIDCQALIEITKKLTGEGADIFEINTVRKHLSEVQGGHLVRLCYPAQVVSLIFSDVLRNDISVVASGPTALDTTTIEDAQKVLIKYNIPDCKFTETPKDQKFFANVKNILVASNKDALEAMKIKAEELDFSAFIETETLSGNASEIGKSLALREAKSKTCFLFGGETTTKIKGNGIGGRNQEMALSALSYMQPDSVLVCTASDGWDNTDHAGAIVDLELFEKSKKLGMFPEEYLDQNDSYNFFKKIGGAIFTGRLESNVSDLVILIHK